jgi:ABC-type phosphate/phosphonate transport system substrate-binding protein
MVGVRRWPRGGGAAAGLCALLAVASCKGSSPSGAGGADGGAAGAAAGRGSGAGVVKAGTAPSEVAPKGLRLGFVRGQLSGDRPALLAELTQILGQRLGDVAGGPVSPLVTADYERLSAALQGGTVELAWLPPLEVAAALEQGAHALVVAVRRGSPSYRSALLVKSGGRVSKPADLRGQPVAWVDHHSAAGYLYARDWLLSQGLGKGAVAERFVGSHRAACEALVKGEVKAAATWMNERSAPSDDQSDRRATGSADRVDGCWQEVGAGSDALTLLGHFGPIPGDALMAARPLSTALRDRLISELEQLHEHPRGAALLRDLLGAEKLVQASGEVKSYRQVSEVRGRLKAAGLE